MNLATPNCWGYYQRLNIGLSLCQPFQTSTRYSENLHHHNRRRHPPLAVVQHDKHASGRRVNGLIVMAIGISDEVIKDTGVDEVEQKTDSVVERRHLSDNVAVLFLRLPPPRKYRQTTTICNEKHDGKKRDHHETLDCTRPT